MLRSMTGFSRIEMEGKGKKFFFEARSLNNRFLEITIRIPRMEYMIEKTLRDIVKNYVKRGKIDIVVKPEKGVNSAAIPKINEEVLNRYLEIAKILRKNYKIKGEIKVEHLLYLKDLLLYEEENALDEEFITHGVRLLLERLNEERIKEGAVIEEDVRKRVEKIKNLLEEIEIRSPISVEEFERRLKERLDFIGKGHSVDEGRIMQEIGFFMEKVDISEEIVRLKGHLKNFVATIEDTLSSGRKLDFIIQEMLREANTIASKSQDLFINERVIEIKVEIEKMREEIQNVE